MDKEAVNLLKELKHSQAWRGALLPLLEKYLSVQDINPMDRDYNSKAAHDMVVFTSGQRHLAKTIIDFVENDAM